MSGFLSLFGSDTISREIAIKLVDLAKVPAYLKQDVVEELVKLKLKRDLKKILEVLSHPCSEIQLKEAYDELYIKLKNADKAIKKGDIDESYRHDVMESVVKSIAVIIAEGYDVIFKENLEFD